MISYYQLYDISVGVFLTFKNKENKRIKTPNHSDKSRDKLKYLFPINKYKIFTIEEFLITNLLINFKKSPTSIPDLFMQLKEIDIKEIENFRDEIKNYRTHILEDIDNISETIGYPSLDDMKNLYYNNKIKWYSFYYFYLLSPKKEQEKMKGRIFDFKFKKIQRIKLYITFSEKSVNIMKKLINENIIKI